MAKKDDTNKNDDGQTSDQSLATGVIKIKLKKAWKGLRPGDSIRCLPEQLARTGLKEGEDYRYVGKFKEPTATTIDQLIVTR